MQGSTAVLEEAEKNVNSAKIKEWGKERWNTTTSLVQKYPGEAVGIAVLTGLVIGALAASAFGDRSTPLDRNIRDLRETGNQAWKVLQQGFEDAIRGVKESVEKATDRLR